MTIWSDGSDDRGCALNRAADGVALAVLDWPVTRVKIRGTWVYTARSNCPSFHLPSRTFAAWRWGYRPYLLAVTHCGRRLNAFTSSMEPPAGKEMCDDCAFADMRGPVVYRFFDSSDRLLYVGFSAFYPGRFKSHARVKESAAWWPLQVRYTITHYDTEDEALAAETAAIIAELPAFNSRNVPAANRARAADLQELCLTSPVPA